MPLQIGIEKGSRLTAVCVGVLQYCQYSQKKISLITLLSDLVHPLTFRPFHVKPTDRSEIFNPTQRTLIQLSTASMPKVMAIVRWQLYDRRAWILKSFNHHYFKTKKLTALKTNMDIYTHDIQQLQILKQINEEQDCELCWLGM